MTSATPPLSKTDQDEPEGKSVWVEPSVMKIDVGDAEAGDGSGPDGGLIS